MRWRVELGRASIVRTMAFGQKETVTRMAKLTAVKRAERTLRRRLRASAAKALATKRAVLRFSDMAAQGDVLFRRISALPAGVTSAPAENGRYIIAHSETGHHHTVDVVPGVEMFIGADPMIAYLQVAEDGLASAVHQRSYHTHATVVFPKGIFELRRQREMSPEGWKRVQD